MTLTPGFFAFAQSQGDLLFGKVLARDGLNLAPASLTRAAARRARAGIRALEAYLRRVILLLALVLEPDLKADNKPVIPQDRPPNPTQKPQRFQIFTGEQDRPDFTDLHDPWADPSDRAWASHMNRGLPVPTAPLLARLAQLQALLQAPEARARRLAYHLARRRPGLLTAPDFWRCPVRSRHGTELSALYTGMAAAIIQMSRIRPPPLGPRPRAGPRLRWL
ncbi:MAG: hypothetical protein QNI84_06585 [Henriciella sp.]|nr:hypothetical protein [Henriciella sp.]